MLMQNKPTDQLYGNLLATMNIFKGDKFSEEHISELLEIIDILRERAFKYEDLSN